MPSKKETAYFSVSPEMILTGTGLPYDLYINSSSLPDRQRFVRIYKKGDVLGQTTPHECRDKYHQIYILESQRSVYLKTLLGQEQLTEIQKTEVIKDSAIKYLHSLFDQKKEFTTELLTETIQGCRESVESMVELIQDYSIMDLQKIIAKLSYHDFYTYDHSINVSMYCINMYKQYRPEASKKDLVLIGLGGLLHDIGKLKLSTQLINKPGDLSEEEFAEIKKHPEHGFHLLKAEGHECGGVDLEIISRIVLEHHENYNGTGYPRKLKGTEIHVMSRITAVADFFDAITTHRSYHEALSVDKAIEVMSKSKGRKIDPQLFDVLLSIIKKSSPSSRQHLQLPDDFDPCQPHNVLPFQEVEKEDKRQRFELSDKNQDFGKVIVEGQKHVANGPAKGKNREEEDS